MRMTMVGMSAEKRTLLDALLSTDSDRPDGTRRIPRRSTSGPVELSFSQQRLWFLDQLVAANAFYNVPASLRLGVALDVGLLERCVNEIVARHEALRTTFVSVEGEPRQVVAPELVVRAGVQDLSALEAGER